MLAQTILDWFSVLTWVVCCCWGWGELVTAIGSRGPFCASYLVVRPWWNLGVVRGFAPRCDVVPVERFVNGGDL